MHDARHSHIPRLLTSTTNNRAAPISVLMNLSNHFDLSERFDGMLTSLRLPLQETLKRARGGWRQRVDQETRMMSKFGQCRVWQEGGPAGGRTETNHLPSFL